MTTGGKSSANQAPGSPAMQITIRVVNALNFWAAAPCGRGSAGYRHSDDVRIVVDRVMDHVSACDRCARVSGEAGNAQ